MLNKKLQNITDQDLKFLIENKVMEGKSIEYKEELPGCSDGNKKEFLADVSSFANTRGGDLIIGIKEEKGFPVDITGLDIDNLDTEIGRLESIIDSGLKPKIQHSIHHIKLENDKVVIFIRIRQSWIGPHRVIFKGHDKFYGRNANGKYPLDVEELRSVFNLSDTISKRIKEFYFSRITDIECGEAPLPITGLRKVILHLIPFESFSTKINLETEKLLEFYNRVDDLRPMNSSSWFSPQINLSGVISHAGEERNKACSYVQIFRNGVIEAVESSILEIGETREIASYPLENGILKYATKYLSVLQSLQFNPPIFIFITLTNIHGLIIKYDTVKFNFDAHEIREIIINLPEIVIENYDQILAQKFRLTFDLIWNACGMPRSLNFDKEGNWIEKS